MDTGSAQWRTSSYSGTSGGQCIEVSQPAAIAVRDSKDRTGTVLEFPASAWRKFIDGIN
jgi:Domain of unknown function (DUF397)